MSILRTVTPVTHDLGSFEVRRAVPSPECRMIGPFVFVDQFGPAREIHAGSGWFSQNSPVQVFGGTNVIAAVAVRWPGGRITTNAVPEGAREVAVDASGTVKVIR